MNRRLIKTANGKGLYEIRGEYGTWQEWLPLPRPEPAVDPALLLLAQSTPKVPTLPGGLHGNQDDRRADERRRQADKVLKEHGLRPDTW
jgi:hypothetical protein